MATRRVSKNYIIKDLYNFLNFRRYYLKKYTYKELRKVCKEGHWDRYKIDEILIRNEVEERLKGDRENED